VAGIAAPKVGYRSGEPRCRRLPLKGLPHNRGPSEVVPVLELQILPALVKKVPIALEFENCLHFDQLVQRP
jgi:hypothetical protein